MSTPTTPPTPTHKDVVTSGNTTKPVEQNSSKDTSRFKFLRKAGTVLIVLGSGIAAAVHAHGDNGQQQREIRENQPADEQRHREVIELDSGLKADVDNNEIVNNSLGAPENLGVSSQTEGVKSVTFSETDRAAYMESKAAKMAEKGLSPSGQLLGGSEGSLA